MATMTPAEEAQFIAWWHEGLSTQEIAARLEIPVPTVSSRAATLRKRGVDLPKRPNGGAYPRRAREIPQETDGWAGQGHPMMVGQWCPR